MKETNTRMWDNMDQINKKHLLDCFPYNENYSPRVQQINILFQIEQLLNQGKRFIIIQAPTGVGKSAISASLLNYFQSGYVCTGKKTLQAQYLKDFPFMKEVRGRSNFICKSSEDKTCDEGMCKKDKDFKCEYKPIYSESLGKLIWKQNQAEKCSYWVNKLDAIESPSVIHNYSYLVTESNYIGGFKQRDVLILDEGHNIESVIMDFIDLDITDQFLKSLNKYHKDKNFQFIKTDQKESNNYKLKLHAGWLFARNNDITETLNIIKTKKEEFKKREQEAKKELERLNYTLEHRLYNRDDLEELKILEDRIKSLKNFDTKPYEDLCNDENILSSLQDHKLKFFLEHIHNELDNWVVKESFSSSSGNIYKLQFQPIFVSPYTEDTLFRLGKTVIIMSATVLNHSILAKNLGIPSDKIGYIEEKSFFPKENNLIFNLHLADFSYYDKDTLEDKETFYSQVVERIDLILDLFYNEKGIIHCTSYEILDYVLKHSIYTHRLISHDASNREERLHEPF